MGRIVEVDQSKCVGAANCEFRAMNTFEVGPEGKSHVIDPEGDSLEEVQLAADECPVQAITVRAEESSEARS